MCGKLVVPRYIAAGTEKTFHLSVCNGLPAMQTFAQFIVADHVGEMHVGITKQDDFCMRSLLIDVFALLHQIGKGTHVATRSTVDTCDNHLSFIPAKRPFTSPHGDPQDAPRAETFQFNNAGLQCSVHTHVDSVPLSGAHAQYDKGKIGGRRAPSGILAPGGTQI